MSRESATDGWNGKRRKTATIAATAMDNLSVGKVRQGEWTNEGRTLERHLIQRVTPDHLPDQWAKDIRSCRNHQQQGAREPPIIH
ncbi:hypothetical protein AB6A40_011437 [Gnathostoma spinigerum]|uniref:Uncharacterized protein n=1 Tax=Gnathostoma spinigerum TaxID=75299 RepID=A0ABD6EXM7_9BILA